MAKQHIPLEINEMLFLTKICKSINRITSIKSIPMYYSAKFREVQVFGKLDGYDIEYIKKQFRLKFNRNIKFVHSSEQDSYLISIA